MSASASAPSGARVARSRTLHADHQSRAANVAEPGVARRDHQQPRTELRPAGRGVGDELLLLDRLEDGDPRRARDRDSRRTSSRGRRGPSAGEALAAGDERTQRQPVRDALRRADDVGNDPGMLEAPHPTRPAVAGLDLVADEQDAVPVAQRAEAPEELEQRGNVAALAEHGLDQHGRHVRGLDGLREQPFRSAPNAPSVAARSSPAYPRYALGYGVMCTAGQERTVPGLVVGGSTS